MIGRDFPVLAIAPPGRAQEGMRSLVENLKERGAELLVIGDDEAMLEGAYQPSSSVPATVIGVITFFIGATGAFLELQHDLDAIWRACRIISTSRP